MPILSRKVIVDEQDAHAGHRAGRIALAQATADAGQAVGALSGGFRMFESAALHAGDFTVTQARLADHGLAEFSNVRQKPSRVHCQRPCSTVQSG
jgi:hypothetical protein